MGTSDNLLYGVAAASASDVWAVGNYYDPNFAVRQTLTEHWNGSAWSVVSSPNAGPNDNVLYAVGAASSSDVWAVGFQSTGLAAIPITEHWNGSTWSLVSISGVGIYDNYLYSVAAQPNGEAWAVGYYKSTNTGPALTLLEHWDGSAWSVVSSPNVGTSDNVLNSVATTSGNVWAAGYYRSGSVNQTLVERYNPCPTSPTPTRTPTGTPTGTATPTGTSTSTPTYTPTPCIPSYTYVTAILTPASITTDTGNHCDDCTTVITLPFTFQFYGQPFTQVALSSNGNMQFASNNPSSANTCLYDRTFNYMIAPFWDDLNTVDFSGHGCFPGCGIYTSLTGSFPNRTF